MGVKLGCANINSLDWFLDGIYWTNGFEWNIFFFFLWKNPVILIILSFLHDKCDNLIQYDLISLVLHEGCIYEYIVWVLVWDRLLF
jgi:hypothetical protein